MTAPSNWNIGQLFPRPFDVCISMRPRNNDDCLTLIIRTLKAWTKGYSEGLISVAGKCRGEPIYLGFSQLCLKASVRARRQCPPLDWFSIEARPMAIRWPGESGHSIVPSAMRLTRTLLAGGSTLLCYYHNAGRLMKVTLLPEGESKPAIWD